MINGTPNNEMVERRRVSLQMARMIRKLVRTQRVLGAGPSLRFALIREARTSAIFKWYVPWSEIVHESLLPSRIEAVLRTSTRVSFVTLKRRFSLRLTAFVGVLAALTCAASSSAADLSKEQVTAALHTIERTATAIAAGKYTTKAQLRGPARTIAIEWAKAEPVVVNRGFAIVETRFVNRSIAAFERDWKDPAKARTNARDVQTNVADLLRTRREYGRPASPAPPTPAP